MSVTVSTTPETKALLIARRAAAKELRMPVTDWRVRRYALLMVAHDQITARLANGEGVNVDALLKLDASMQEIRSSVPDERHTIRIAYAEGIIGVCPHCKAEIPDYRAPESTAIESKPKVPAVGQPPEPKPLSAATPAPANHIVERPYHETHAKDSRPNPGIGLGDVRGSLCWSGQGKLA
jgi:hypothetical protein